MSSEERRITIKIFCWVIGTLAAVWATAYGYTWIRLGSVEAKNESIIGNYNEVSIKYSDVNVQLSQIQTDLTWIRKNLDRLDYAKR